MEKQIEIGLEKRGFPWPVIGTVANRSTCGGIVHGKRYYKAASWKRALEHVEEILLRGNAVRVVNVAGEFSINELVMK